MTVPDWGIPMQTIALTVDVPDATSRDYDWLADKVFDFMHDFLHVQPYAPDGSLVTDADGVPIEDTVQSLTTALIWRMRETFKPDDD